mmetsp:Transcript_13561/g.25579  ORF Transcript_13561/g.25579 Transcript_13561/m.25579 type:complete len:548 (-) Transcript_13561:14-1657(-)
MKLRTPLYLCMTVVLRLLSYKEDIGIIMEQRLSQFVKPLLTDTYQLTMSYAYWKQGRQDEPAVFEAYFRKCPFGGEYCYFAGLSDVLEFVKGFSFTATDIEFLKATFPQTEPEYFEWLASTNSSQVKISAVAEGSLVFSQTPLVRVEGPLAICQIMETTILNLVNFASLITTNAVRHVKAAGPGKILSEFGLRRAQGPDGAMSASRYSYAGGFHSTSNTLAGKLYGIPIQGTHAHSFVLSFSSDSDLHLRTLKDQDLLELAKKYRTELGYDTNESELLSFVAYAAAFPSNFKSLVDTYDTLASGVPNFICVALALNSLGYKADGIRLDSGDLAELSKGARRLINSVGERYGVDFSGVKIVASNDINEKALHQLNAAGHEIDVFGIGTNLVTCQAQPALGMVYKLVEINAVPRIKLSNVKEKMSIPGKKEIYRLFNPEGKAVVDLMAFSSEPVPEVGERILVRHPFNDSIRNYITPARVERLHDLYWAGAEVRPADSLEVVRARVIEQWNYLSDSVIVKNKPYNVSLSQSLHGFMRELWEKESPITEI